MRRGALRILAIPVGLASLVHLAPAQLHTWLGDELHDSFGLSVDRIGDLDGDGVDELIVGAPHAEIYGQTGTSSYSRVFSGATHALLYDDHEFGGDEHRGLRVRGIGDWTGDGLPDYVVTTAPHPDYASVRASARVFSGADGSLVLAILVPEWNYLGWQWIDGAGDVNGDGFADLVLGAYHAANGKGVARVYGGPHGTLLQAFRGQGGDLGLGLYVAGVGDWNGDGRDDIAASTIPQGEQHTDVYSVVDGALLFRVEHAGEIGDPGDYDGDGHRDLLVDGTVYSGSDGDPLLVSTDWLRHRPIPDVSCDGIADFLASHPGEGRVAVLSGADASVLEILYDAGGSAGFDVALAGDTDGDGVLDVLVGSPDNPPGGAARLFTGYSPPPPTNYCIGAQNSTGFSGEIGHSGSREISSNDLQLEAYTCPPQEFGLFFYGADAIQAPFGDGFLCVGGKCFRLGPPTVTDGAGTAIRPVDFTAPPMNSGPGEVVPGSTWRFQFWYRDPMSGGARFNLTNGLEITFCQ